MTFKHTVVIGAAMVALLAAGRSCQRSDIASAGEPVVLTQPHAPPPAAIDTSLAGFSGALDLASGQTVVSTASVPPVRHEPALPPDAASLIASDEPAAPSGVQIDRQGDRP